MDWHGLARIGKNWQIGEFVSERKVGPRLAPNWHGLTWIDMDWHGLARIGKNWQIGEFVSERKVGPRLAPDWHGLTWIDMENTGLASALPIQIGASIGFGLAQDWLIGPDWHGLADWIFKKGEYFTLMIVQSGLAWIGKDWSIIGPGLLWISLK